jgi:microcystin-dependent protein
MSTTDLRPPRETPNLGLPVPGDAEPSDGPSDIGDLADAVDALAPFLIVNAGDLRPTASNNVPAGWLLCDGRAVERGQYVDLFDAIGTAYGAGDGSTTFNLPDLRGRVPLGAGPSDALGGAGGARRVALTVEQMPSHAHSVYDPSHAHGVYDPTHVHPDYGHAHGVSDPGHAHTIPNLAGGNCKVVVWTSGSQGQNWIAPGTGQLGSYGSGTGIGIYGSGAAQGASGTGIGIYGAATGISLYAAGNGWDHENMPPYQAINWLIKT